ncbi:N-acetylmuramoyl-L-alanine amidase [Flavobacteriaceae bacterium MAR_2010_72]|nr:N-acetylmuramoyl-L-alanine amidase [Flavobacteriaceae bacterium MAR_2010_72]TVZ59670.1 N-acetylmuramoyl-L-alanine amidase [Flavobacteriaceae bacterium MAR_2010_105]
MRTHITILIVFFSISLTFASPLSGRKDKFVVVLDAGHGGSDPGNVGNGYKEKDIALEIVLEIGKKLEKNPNIKVVYTRKTDVFVDLFVRGKIANEADADLFVSVHCNSHHSQAHGTETFVLGVHRNQTNFEVAKKENAVIFLEDDYEKNYGGFDPNSPEAIIGILLGQEEYLDQSILLASKIQHNFTENLKRVNRGVKQAGFIVLHQTVMPSVLVEVGFLTYKPEGSYLNSRKGQSDMSESIYQAILDYKKAVDLYIGEDLVNVNTNESANSSVSDSIFPDITFKVQIAAGSKKLEPKSYNFKGLDDISIEHSGNLYRYFYGSTSDYKIAKRLEQEAKKNYRSCFIVAFKGGKRIELSEAFKSTSN